MAEVARDLGINYKTRLVNHSDRGAVYTSLAFGNRAAELGIARSFGSTGDCYDCEDPLAVVRPLEGSQPLSLRVA
jgi:hypothetical protein